MNTWRALLALLALLPCVAQCIAAENLSLPRGTGLPLVVRTAISFLAVDTIDDSSASFAATVDVRLIWQDPRLVYPAAAAPSGVLEYRDAAAEQRLQEIWYPQLSLANLIDEAAYERRGLRIYPDGTVELMQRTRGLFSAPYEVDRFPFDSQRLAVELVSTRDPDNEVVLDFRQADLDFGRVSKRLKVSGWQIGTIDLVRQAQPGWHGQTHSSLIAALLVERDPTGMIGPIFIPLFASLLIPLLALWLNQTDRNGEFKVDAFEVTNVLIGGLFALIALDFTINSAYPMLVGDNPVSMLFGLNYVLLAANLAVTILLTRFALIQRWFGTHVQNELYAVLVWAMPAAVAVAVAAILLRAMA